MLSYLPNLGIFTFSASSGPQNFQPVLFTVSTPSAIPSSSSVAQYMPKDIQRHIRVRCTFFYLFVKSFLTTLPQNIDSVSCLIHPLFQPITILCIPNIVEQYILINPKTLLLLSNTILHLLR